jgi:hypothetical protein
MLVRTVISAAVADRDTVSTASTATAAALVDLHMMSSSSRPLALLRPSFAGRLKILEPGHQHISGAWPSGRASHRAGYGAAAVNV